MIGAMAEEAMRALAANRLRSALTMLGMIIGVSAVILMLAIGSGVQAFVTRSISALGSNLLIVNSGAARTGGGFSQGAASAPTLSVGDWRAIEALPGVAAAAPQATLQAQVQAGPANWFTLVYATTPGWFVVQEWFPDRGRAFTDVEERQAARVAVLGRRVADELFGANEPLGQKLRIRGVSFKVVGVLPTRGQGIGGQDRDDVVVIPFTSSQRLIQGGGAFRQSVRTILVSAERSDRLEATQEAIADLLRRRHGIRAGEPDDFSITNVTAVGDTFKETTGAISLLLGAIGGISLVVGGIGIMNIMLVSVTERTREIGIRMAIGAPRAAIRLQFLLEALALSLTGCLVGVALGIGLSLLAGRALPFETVVTAGSVVAAFLISAAVGIFFGWYPAQRAARLSPIEALRS